MGYSSQQALTEEIRFDVQRGLADDAFSELEAIWLICVARDTAFWADDDDETSALAAIRRRAAAILRR